MHLPMPWQGHLSDETGVHHMPGMSKQVRDEYMECCLRGSASWHGIALPYPMAFTGLLAEFLLPHQVLLHAQQSLCNPFDEGAEFF